MLAAMSREPRSLAGGVAAVTGAARGIGLATAQALAAQGMKVAIGDIDAGEAQQAATLVGSDAIALPLDVTQRQSVRTFLDQVEARLGPLDVLVNNAGIMPLGSFLDEPDDRTQRQIDINVNGVIYGMKEALPRMLSRRRGHLVNIASSAGKGGYAGAATYCGTKHFVVGLSEAVRAETRGTGIEISCVMPGVVNTELTTGMASARTIKTVEASDVADAIVEALQVPRFDVFVPKAIGPIGAVMGLLPRRGREAVGRALKADTLLSSADPEARRAYELRAARTTPLLEETNTEEKV
jgi:NADP-dependent 3-hydroxy acid dehydrogenase YdfG